MTPATGCYARFAAHYLMRQCLYEAAYDKHDKHMGTATDLGPICRHHLGRRDPRIGSK